MFLDSKKFMRYSLNEEERNTLMRAVTIIQREEARLAIHAEQVRSAMTPGCPCPACGYIHYNPRCEFCRDNRFSAEEID